MLLPKRVKYRRVHRGRLTGKAMRGNKITYGEFGLVALEPAWITSNQFVSHAVHDQDPLNGGTTLAGVAKGPSHDVLGSQIQVGVFQNDRRVLAAKLKHDWPHAGQLANVLADCG